MVKQVELVHGLLDNWTDVPCPFCREIPKPTYLVLLSSITFHCSYCDEVIEGFELCVDESGEAWTEQHVIYVRGQLSGRTPVAVRVHARE